MFISWKIASIIIIISALGITLLRHYKTGCLYNIPADLNVKGRTALITGGNSGIGLVTAKVLAGQGVNVILACRSLDQCHQAAEEVKEFARKQQSDANVDTEELDLSSLESVHNCARRVIHNYPKLHYLINNAGIMGSAELERSKNGHELHFAVNHLGHFLLTQLLLPHMKKSREEVRIINVSSAAHYYLAEGVNFTSPGEYPTYSRWSSYAQSKLANVLHARELARRENEHLDGRREKPQVIAVSLHPGSISTNMGRHLHPILFFFFKHVLHYIVFKNDWEGAQTTLFCVLDPSVSQFNGAYFSDCKPIVSTLEAQSNDAARDLWRVSEELVYKYT